MKSAPIFAIYVLVASQSASANAVPQPKDDTKAITSKNADAAKLAKERNDLLPGSSGR